jgi:predicted SAM-dependent methyltransferase
MLSPRLRQKVKRVMRPAALPLLRRIQRPFDMLLPRVEALERGLAALPSLGSPDSALRDTCDNLTRAWLRLQNEVSRLASTLPETAANVARAELGDLETRLRREVEERTGRLAQVTASATRTQLQELEARWREQIAGLAGGVADSIANSVYDRIAGREQELRSEVSRLSVEGAARDERLRTLRRAWEDDLEARQHRVDDTLRYLLERVEFVRREMLFELRYGPDDVPGRRTRPQSRVVAPEKLQAACRAGALRLNLGCGHIPLDGFINVDMRELPGVDVIAEAGDLPFEPATVSEIASAHLVEHFAQEDLRRRLLPHWRRLLKPGGILRAVTPDGEAMLAGLAQGTYTFEDFRDVLFGGQDYDGDFHMNLFTPETFRRMVEEAGFIGIEVPVRGRRNGQCFEFELTAKLPETIGR